MSEERDKDIPAFGLEVQDTRLRQKLEAMREAIQKLMGTRGVGGGRAAVRWDDLKEGGLVSQAARRIDLAGAVNEAIGSGAVDVGNDAEPDLTKPPTPTGLAAVAGLGNVLVEWGAPIYTAGRGHKQTNIYATKQPAADNTAYTINDAVRVDSAVGPLTVIALPSDLGVKWRIWIRFESNDGVESDPAGGVNGVVATTGLIGNADLGDLIVEAGNLAAGAVTAAKFGAGIEPVTIITAASLPTTKSTNAIYWSDKLYRWNGAAYVATVPTTDLSGQVADAQIAGLAASKVTGQLSDSQIAAVAAAKLTGQIVGTQITDGAISTAKLSAGSVTTAVLAVDAVTADKIAANAVTASEIAAGAVTTAKLAAGAVTANEIAAGAITTAKLAAGAVTASEIAADAVTAGKIQAGAITANKLAANAIAVGTAAVENGAIVNAMIATAAIDDAKIANLSAAKLTAGDGTIGGNLRSSNYVAGSLGWMVRPDGFAEFNDIVVRGTVFASAGAIGGSLIGSNYIQSTNWTNLTTGWRLNNDGTGQVGGIAILTDRIQSGNYSENAQGFAWRADGTGQIGGLKVTATGIESSNFVPGAAGFQLTYDGNIFARGNIEATSLKVDAANIVRTIHLQNNAVTVPVSKQWIGSLDIPNGASVEVVRTDPADFGGQPVFLTCYVEITAANTSTGVSVFIKRVSGSGVSDTVWSGPASGLVYTAIGVGVDTPPTGNVQYSVEVAWAFGGGSRSATKALITALGVKK